MPVTSTTNPLLQTSATDSTTPTASSPSTASTTLPAAPIATPLGGATPQSGLINTDAHSAFDTGSGAFGVQTLGAPKTTDPAYLKLDDLDRRNVSAPTETVSGQMNNLLGADSQYMQSARADAAGASNARGLLNSSMAATAGEKAAIDSALPIAQADAGIYGKAADYNTALTNQARMYNADTQNKVATQQTGIDADTAARQMAIEADKATAAAQQKAQKDIAQLQSDTTKYGADKTAESAANQQASQQTVAQIQAAVSKYQADKQAETSSSNADKSLEDTKAKNKNQLVNNILMTPDLSPDRKAALLTSLGEPDLAAAIQVLGGGGGGGGGGSPQHNDDPSPNDPSTWFNF